MKKKLYTFKLKNDIVCVEWPEEGAFNDILIKGWKLQPLKFVDNYRCNAVYDYAVDRFESYRATSRFDDSC